MKIYIDFDGTVFNTDKYSEDFMKIFNEYGINKLLFEQAKKILFDDEKLFNISEIVDFFIDEYNVDSSLKIKIDKLLNDLYVYSDVVDCLNILTNYGYELYLLTYGNDTFQRIKINASNLSRFFKDIIITEKDKSKLNIDYKNSIFIDNNPLEIKKFNDAGAKKTIRIRRDNEKFSNIQYSNLNSFDCKNFNEIIKLLKGGFKNE